MRVCLFDRPPFFYINKPVLGHSNEFPLLMIFFITNQKTKDLNFIKIVMGVLDKSGTRIEIAGSQRLQRCPRISRVTPVRLNSQRSNVTLSATFWTNIFFNFVNLSDAMFHNPEQCDRYLNNVSSPGLTSCTTQSPSTSLATTRSRGCCADASFAG